MKVFDQLSSKPSHSLGDSLGMVGILLALLTFIIVPTPITRLVAALIAAPLVTYIAYRSHWVRSWTVTQRVVAGGLTLVVVLCVCCWHFFPRGKSERQAAIPASTLNEPRTDHPQAKTTALTGQSALPKKGKTAAKLSAKLPESSIVSPAPTISASAPVINDHGFINNAPNFGDQRVIDARQYGARSPLPSIEDEVVTPVAGVPMPTFPILPESAPGQTKSEAIWRYRNEVQLGLR